MESVGFFSTTFFVDVARLRKVIEISAAFEFREMQTSIRNFGIFLTVLEVNEKMLQSIFKKKTIDFSPKSIVG